MMDDVWGNAWSQSDKISSEDSQDKLNAAVDAPWSLKATSSSKHEEADIGLPSWSTGEVSWAEPSGEAPLWSSHSASDDLTVETAGWASSSPSGFKIFTGEPDGALPSDDNYRSRSTSPRVEIVSGEEHDTALDDASVPTTVIQSRSAGEEEERESSATALSPHISPTPPFINEFKSEEVASSPAPQETFDDTDLTWTTPTAAEFDDVGDNSWGSAWGSTAKETAHVEEDSKDEWALAQEAKLRRDRSVPPELMAAIYDRLNELSEDIFPNRDAQDQQRYGNWKDGLTAVEGLEDLVKRYTPELGHQPPIQFSNSHIAKSMANSIKLTKNLPLARNSPMAHLFMTKSLTAWELSVKNRVEVIQDDVPPGWRIEPEAKDGKPEFIDKKTGGFLSLFSRRASAVPPSAASTTSRRSSSLSRETSFTSSVKASGTESSRTSVESSLKSPSMPGPPLRTSEGKLPQASAVSTGVQLATTESTTSSPTQEATTTVATSPAPSVVSRFFNRFSRTRSDLRSSSLSPRSSLALSTNDLEFLSDFPSHANDADEDDQLAALSALVSSPPISANLPAPLPPPLVPPPLAPPPQGLQSRPQSRISQPLSPVREGTRAPALLADFQDFIQASPREPLRAQIPALPPPSPTPLIPPPPIGLSKPPMPLNTQNTFRAGSYAKPETFPSALRTPSPEPQPPKIAELSIVTETNDGLRSRSSLPPSASLVTPISALKKEGQTTSLLSSPDAPPPLEKSPNRIYTQPSSTNTFDDDDFSDFQSPTTASSLSQPFTRARQGRSLAFSDVSYEAQSDQSLLSGNRTTEDDLFGDFGDFVTPATQPPRPAVPQAPTSKPLPPSLSRSSSSATIPPTPPEKHVPKEIKTSHIRKPSAAEREAAIHLVERAAAHKGRWPAPLTPLPSPLPAPLPSPSDLTKIMSVPTHDQLLLDLGDSINLTTTPGRRSTSSALKPISQITAFVRSSSASPAPAFSLPPVPAVQSEASMPSLLDWDVPFSSSSLSTRSQPPSNGPYVPSAPKPPSAVASQKGGLSARDLSFFEGL